MMLGRAHKAASGLRNRQLERVAYGTPPRYAPNVLFVGAERNDEFAHAMRLALKGHYGMSVNPRETKAAKPFRQPGGRFIRARIEELPRDSCRFHLICGNYPYPSRRSYVRPRPFALARLSLLRPGGKW